MTERPTASSEATSRRMSKQATKNTRPELDIRRRLHATGLRYRVDYQPLPQLRRRADIAFPRHNIAVFVDGCFWHSCPEHATSPKSNGEWWAAKLERNRARDAETNSALTEAGWKVVRIWEHEDPDVAAAKVERAVRASAGESP